MEEKSVKTLITLRNVLYNVRVIASIGYTDSELQRDRRLK